MEAHPHPDGRFGRPRRTRLVRVPVELPNRDQLSLAGTGRYVKPQEETIQQRFERFDRENPQVYAELVVLARRWAATGNKKCGVGMLFEVLRWRRGLRTGGDDFKLNNSYRSRYVRKIISNYPELAPLFETRTLHAE